MWRWPRPIAALLAALSVAAGQLAAQQPDAALTDLTVRLAGMTAVTGYEQAAVDTLLRLLRGARRDRAGNAVLVLGKGEPRRLVACPLDEPGYVVAGVRPDGYLTLRGVPGQRPAFFDQQFEGHRVTVHGAAGPVPGVVGTPSIHLGGRAADADEPFTVERAFVDVGAASSEEVARLGVQMLSQVALAKRPHRYGADLLAAPVAGSRAACAALVAAAAQAAQNSGTPPAAGTVVVAFTVEQRLSGRGLAALAHLAGPFQETLLLQAPSSSAWPELGTVGTRALTVRYAGTAVETVSLGAVDSLRHDLHRWIRGGP